MQNDRISFDQILASKLGFGPYQILIFSIVSFVDFIDGSESFFMIILVQILSKEWGLDSHQIEMLGSLYYFGFFMGAIVAGLLCDHIGRKKTMIGGSFVQLMTVLWNAVAQNYVQMIIIRFLYGFVIGLTIPIGVLICTEICVYHLRGRALIIIQSASLLGKFYLIFLCVFFLVSLEEGNWRAMAVCQAIPTAIMVVLCVLFLDESPRFLLAQGKYDEAIKIMDMIGKKNHKNRIYECITEEEKQKLINWQIYTFQQESKYSKWEVFKGLFQGENLPVTWRLIVASMNTQFISSGFTFILPFLFQNSGLGIIELLLANLAEIPASVLVYFLIDTKKVGRVRIIWVSLSICVVIYWMIYIFKDAFLLIGFGGILFFAKLCGLVSQPIASESYDTIFRSMGLATCVSFGRVAGSIAPFILYELYLYDKWLIFPICSLFLVATVIIFGTFPVDKTQKQLDVRREAEQEEEEKYFVVQNNNSNENNENEIQQEKNENQILQDKNEKEIQQEKKQV